MVPHRRGNDGYLLVQLTPPAAEGNWRREVLPEGSALNLALLCDASASMDAEKRQQQAEFVASILSSLGDKDRFMVAATDAATVWAAPEPLPPAAKNLAMARDFLQQRASLGWTDLDQAWDAVLQKAPAGAHIVYVGDGIVSAGDRNPTSLVNRLTKRWGQHRAAGLVLHAVTVGSTSESTVMQGIAAVGGGSVWAIGGDRSAPTVALELLSDIAQPGLRDLKVEFKGVKMAAVYPDRLPNLPAGTQQILVGRYLPDGKQQQGEVIITGRRGEQPVRYTAVVRFPDADEGNSFIPRLWARSHLDHLLAQGDNPQTHDEIVGLSEEFHIITPFTSLLVLENDAARERFGVKKRFEMRDGERFFAEGKADTNFALAQQQAQLAATWRLGLRQKILRELNKHDRDNRLFQSPPTALDQERATQHFNRWTTSHDDREQAVKNGIVRTDERLRAPTAQFNRALDVNSAAVALGMLSKWSTRQEVRAARTAIGGGILGSVEAEPADGHRSRANRARVDDGNDPDAEEDDEEDQSDAFESGDARLNINAAGNSTADMPTEGSQHLASDEADPSDPSDDSLLDSHRSTSVGTTGTKLTGMGNELQALRDKGEAQHQQAMMMACSIGTIPRYFPESFGFSTLPSPPGVLPPPQRPVGWSPAAYELCLGLLRLDTLRAMGGGIELRSAEDRFESGWAQATSHRESVVLYSRQGWLIRPNARSGEPVVNFCRAGECGVLSSAYLLGQKRPATEHDLDLPPFEMSDGSLSPLFAACWPTEQGRAEPAGEDQVMLVIRNRVSGDEKRYLIDTARHVLVSGEQIKDGRSIGKATFSDFVQVAGSWWARKQLVADGSGRKLHETTLEIVALKQDAFDERMQAELAALPSVQFLQNPLPSVDLARQRVADGAADFTDQMIMFAHYRSLQQWDQALRHLAEAEKVAPDMPGIHWVRTFALAFGRRTDEARQRLLEEARRLVATPQTEEMFLAGALVNCTDPFRANANRVELFEALMPVVDRQPADSPAHISWQSHLADARERQRPAEAALALRKRLAENTPWDIQAQTRYVYQLASSKERAAARNWLKQLLAQPDARGDDANEELRKDYADLLSKQALWQEHLEFTKTWIEDNPLSQNAYEHYFSALVGNEQLEAANDLAERWLKQAQIEGPVGPELQARFKAAARRAHSTSWSSDPARLDQRWIVPLSDACLFFVRQGHLDLAYDALGWSRDDTDFIEPLRGEFFQMLRIKAKQLSAQQVEFLVGHCVDVSLTLVEPVDGRKQFTASEVPTELWKEVADPLRARWDQSADEVEKDILGKALELIYRAKFADSELLPFLRQRVKTSAPATRDENTADLFNSLLKNSWSEEIEGEALQLLPQLAAAAEPASRLTIQIAALYRLVNGMLAARQARAERELRDQGHLDELTRTELATQRETCRQAAERALAERLASQAALARQQQSSLADWLLIEWARLNTRVGVRSDETLAFCWEKLADAPPKHEPAFAITSDDLETPEAKQAALDALLRRRALATAMNLAAHPGANPKDIDRLLRYIDTGITQGGETAAAWRRTKYQLLVALDRPDQLEQALRGWIRTDRSQAPWRQSLALLLAERGKLDEAIRLFESAGQDQLLTADDYWTLANWYQAQNRRAE